MVPIPTIEEEDARRPNREHQNLVTEQTRTQPDQKRYLSASAFVRCGRPCARLQKRRSAHGGRPVRAANHWARALSFWNLTKRQAADRRAGTRKTMIVALARKLLIGL